MVHAPNMADNYPPFQPQNPLIVRAAAAGHTTRNRRAIAGEEPSEALLLLLEHADDGLLEQVDVEHAHKNVAAHGKDVEHLQRTEARHEVTLPIAYSLHQVVDDALEGALPAPASALTGPARVVLVRRRQPGGGDIGGVCAA